GVSMINSIRARRERILVEFWQDRLATLGVARQLVLSALSQQNLLTPAGSVEANGPQVQVRIDGAFDDLDKIRNVPIVADGKTLRLTDIAEVRRGYEDPATFLVRSQGEPALLLGVVMREGWNGLELGKSLQAEVHAIAAELPLGMSFTQVTDQSVN